MAAKRAETGGHSHLGCAAFEMTPQLTAAAAYQPLWLSAAARLPTFFSATPSYSFEPASDRPSNLVGSVLLHEVETSDDDAVLIREAARQSSDSARDEHTGLRVNKELRQRRCFQPCGVGGNPIMDISRLARQRHFACPLQCRPAIVAGLQEWSPVLCHLVRRQRPLRDAGQHLLDEHVLTEHQSFARRRTHGLQRRTEAFWQILQGERSNERLHISYRANALLMTIRPVEAQGPSPVVQDERQWLRSDHLIDKGVNVTGVAREAVAVRLGAGRDLVRVAHADEIRGDQPAAGVADVRQDTSP